jgi:hypothetical protein
MAIESQIRLAIRDAVNRTSRKPFHWGGLAGYQQLEAIAQALHSMPQEADTAYLHGLAAQVDRALQKSRWLAEDLAQAHCWLMRIAECLRYPPSTSPASGSQGSALSGEQVRREMEELLQQFPPNLQWQPAQAALEHAWCRLWRTCGPDLLPCYEIRGLPPDNLKMETLFGRLRGHQRRISGRKSTKPLRDLGQYQVLFAAQSEEDLWRELQHVAQEDYQVHRRRLAKAEESRQQLYRWHRDPIGTARRLVEQHAARRTEMARNATMPILIT